MKSDKLLHLLAGYAITLTVGLWSPIAGLIAGMVAGVAKELVWDKWFKKGTPEWRDAGFTGVGSVGACVVLVARDLWNLI